MAGRTPYAKLVRDHIPALIRAEGRRCGTRTLNDEEFRRALLTKLLEEANEVMAASRANVLAELADLLEVIDVLLKVEGLTWTELENEKLGRARARGSFSAKTYLLWAELNPGREARSAKSSPSPHG